MRIGFIVPSLANKGPVLVVRDLVKQFIKHGHSCTVFYLTDIVEVKMVCAIQKIEFTQSVDFSQFEIIHTHGMRPDIYVFLHKTRNLKTKYVSTMHNYVISDLSFQYNKFVAYICGNSWMMLLCRHDRIVTLSKDAMKYYSRWIPKEKLSFVYNTRNIDMTKKLSEDELNQLLEFKAKSTLIGINALLSPRKGIDILIKQLDKLPQFKLCVVGDGKIKNDLIALAKDEHVNDRCLFVGYKKDAYRYLPYYDIFAMPSRSEGFPLALLEAAIYSKPSVVSDIQIVKEAFSAEEVSMFQLKDTESIITAILSATNNSLLGENFNKKYLNCYSPEKMYQGYLSIYQRLLSNEIF